MERPNILIIDDDRSHAVSTADALASSGFHCDVVSSGNEGLARIEANAYDLIITDLRMPDINGIDIVRSARKKSSDCEVIVMTGYAAEETAIEAFNEGASDYIPKPFDLRILRVKIARALVGLNPAMRGTMRKGGFMTRDPREKERKKPGRKGARRSFQFTKR